MAIIETGLCLGGPWDGRRVATDIRDRFMEGRVLNAPSEGFPFADQSIPAAVTVRYDHGLLALDKDHLVGFWYFSEESGVDALIGLFRRYPAERDQSAPRAAAP